MEDHSGHRKRHRERVLSKLHRSLHGATDAELLETLLFAVDPRGDTRPLAEALLNGSGGLEGAVDRSMRELCQVSGVGENTAFLLALVGELSRRADESFSPMPRIRDPESAVAYMKNRLLGLCRDTAFFICLDGDGRAVKCAALDGPLRPENMDRLGPETVKAHSRAVILLHAYPEGAPVRDEEEIRAVLKMSKVLALPGIALLDYIAFSADAFFSLARDGPLPPPPYLERRARS